MSVVTLESLKEAAAMGAKQLENQHADRQYLCEFLLDWLNHAIEYAQNTQNGF